MRWRSVTGAAGPSPARAARAYRGNIDVATVTGPTNTMAARTWTESSTAVTSVSFLRLGKAGSSDREAETSVSVHPLRGHDRAPSPSVRLKPTPRPGLRFTGTRRHLLPARLKLAARSGGVLPQPPEHPHEGAGQEGALGPGDGGEHHP